MDEVEGDRIELTWADNGSHGGHHPNVSEGLVAAIEGKQVRLSAKAGAAALLEEEEGGVPFPIFANNPRVKSLSTKARFFGVPSSREMALSPR